MKSDQTEEIFIENLSDDYNRKARSDPETGNHNIVTSVNMGLGEILDQMLELYYGLPNIIVTLDTDSITEEKTVMGLQLDDAATDEDTMKLSLFLKDFMGCCSDESNMHINADTVVAFVALIYTPGTMAATLYNLMEMRCGQEDDLWEHLDVVLSYMERAEDYVPACKLN